VLRERCHLGPGSDVLEIGPGPGTATRGLVSSGATVTVVEPDPALASYLSDTLRQAPITALVASWEDVDLSDRRFDLVVAANSFHWVDPVTGSAKVREHLRPGAWFAKWWTVFEDPTRRDRFDVAVGALGVAPVFVSDQSTDDVREDSELANLTRAGFVDVGVEEVETERSLDAGEVRRMYASLGGVLRHPPAEQVRLLDEIEMLVDREFGGSLTRRYVTTLYTGRTPGPRFA
jgi:SAM-dependent methyltransferase